MSGVTAFAKTGSPVKLAGVSDTAVIRLQDGAELVMGVHAAQEQQLLDRRLHRGGCRLHRRRRQPRQPGHPEPGIVGQQPVQVTAYLPRQKVADLGSIHS